MVLISPRGREDKGDSRHWTGTSVPPHPFGHGGECSEPQSEADEGPGFSVLVPGRVQTPPLKNSQAPLESCENPDCTSKTANSHDRFGEKERHLLREDNGLVNIANQPFSLLFSPPVSETRNWPLARGPWVGKPFHVTLQHRTQGRSTTLGGAAQLCGF